MGSPILLTDSSSLQYQTITMAITMFVNVDSMLSVKLHIQFCDTFLQSFAITFSLAVKSRSSKRQQSVFRWLLMIADKTLSFTVEGSYA